MYACMYLTVCLCACLSVRPSVLTHGTTLLPLDGFDETWYLSFSKICRENSSLITIWQEEWVRYTKMFAEFLLERDVFQIKVVQKIKIHIILSLTFFPENRAVYDVMSKYVVELERSQMTISRRVACWISKNSRAQAHARATTPTASTHAQVRTKPRARDRARTHTHTKKYVILISFTRTKCFRERSSMLRYTYTACLVSKENILFSTKYERNIYTYLY